MAEIWQLINMIWPMIAGISVIILCFFSKDILDRAITFQLTLFNVVLLSRQLTVLMIRLLFFAVGAALVVYPIFRDYSTFFPQKIRIQVFFDDDGISSTLADLSPDDTNALNLSENWHAAKRAHFDAMNEELRKERLSFQFPVDMSSVHGVGKGNIKFRKIRWGIQEYKLETGDGEIALTTMAPGSTAPRQLKTEYSLVDTNSNFVTVTLRQMYLDRKIVVRPVFQQIITLSPEKKLYHHRLVGITPISIFPPKYLPTLYVVRPEGQKGFPIGYAIYEPDAD